MGGRVESVGLGGRVELSVVWGGSLLLQADEGALATATIGDDLHTASPPEHGVLDRIHNLSGVVFRLLNDGAAHVLL